MKKAKRFWSFLLALALAVSCIAAPVSAAGYAEDGAAIARASGRLDYSIPSGLVYIGAPFYMEVGETVSYDCTYTPASASMDFGFIAPDGTFHAMNSTSGSIDCSIRATQRGEYQLAIRNNESYAVTVTGTVNY